MCNALTRECRLRRLMMLFLAIAFVCDTGVALARRDRPNEQRIKNPPSDIAETAGYVPHQLVVRLTSTAAAGSLALSEEVLSVQAALAHAPVYLLTLDAEVSETALADNLSLWGSVVWAHPNYMMSSLHPIQGSYPFPDQNLVGNFEDQYSSSLLNLPGAHASANGGGVSVAIIDGGINFSHPDLDGKAISGFDFVDGDTDASDVAGGNASGHGTFVAGVAHLTAPAAQLRAYRVIDQDGRGDGFTLARAIETAVDDGCRIINLSLALSARHLAVRDAIDYAVSQGATVVAGAGNGAIGTPVYPAAETNVLSVAAVDSSRLAANFTNFGDHVDVCAPGTQIYSTYLDPAFAWWSGTSFSSAFTSGLAALLQQAHPTALGLQIRNLIEAAATNLDTINPSKSGALGAGLINPVASLASGLGSDTALFFPGMMQFSYFICSQNPAGLEQTGVLVSTNSPAAYSATIVPSGGVTFISVDPMTGSTGDSILITANPAGLAPGVYRNGVMFEITGVEGHVWLPIQLNVLDCSDTTGGAQIAPAELWFTATTGSEIVFQGSAMLTSSNAPAPFTAQLESNPAIFVSLIDSAGVTNDSVRFTVNPAWLFSGGEYTNVINYYIDGVAAPAALTIHLTVGDSIDPGDDAWIMPAEQTYHVSADTALSLWGSITVGAAGEPKPFEVHLKDMPDFLELVDSTGMTNDSAIFWVHVTPALAPGVYRDTLIAYITGAPNSPLVSVVSLWVDTTITGGGDTAAVYPAWQEFEAPNGIPTQGSGGFIIFATGAPKAFSVDYLDTPDFTELQNFSGFTTGAVDFDIVPTTTLPGIYFDTLIVTVAGVANSPLLVVNKLTIDTTGSDTSAATAAVYPDLIVIDAFVGGATELRQALVTSSNAPAWYSAFVMPEPHTFVSLPDTLGQTNDSLTLAVPLSGLAAGTYFDTVLIYITGVPSPVKLAVELRLAAAVGSLRLWNHPNPFNPSTTIGFVVPAAGHVRLELFNILGQRVVTLVDEPLAAGEHSVTWDGRGAPSGVYYYRLTTGALTETRKMLLVK